HAGVIGGRYYQREQTDFEALTRAVENAQRALQLAGSQVDPARLARQLSLDGTPDVAVLDAANDVRGRVEWLVGEAEVLLPESVQTLLDAELVDVATSAGRALPALQRIGAVLNGASEIA